jgi:hypothetical protein
MLLAEHGTFMLVVMLVVNGMWHIVVLQTSNFSLFQVYLNV